MELNRWMLWVFFSAVPEPLSDQLIVKWVVSNYWIIFLALVVQSIILLLSFISLLLPHKFLGSIVYDNLIFAPHSVLYVTIIYAHSKFVGTLRPEMEMLDHATVLQLIFATCSKLYRLWTVPVHVYIDMYTALCLLTRDVATLAVSSAILFNRIVSYVLFIDRMKVWEFVVGHPHFYLQSSVWSK
jgi:hypothetical protein